VADGSRIRLAVALSRWRRRPCEPAVARRGAPARAGYRGGARLGPTARRAHARVVEGLLRPRAVGRTSACSSSFTVRPCKATRIPPGFLDGVIDWLEPIVAAAVASGDPRAAGPRAPAAGRRRHPGPAARPARHRRRGSGGPSDGRLHRP